VTEQLPIVLGEFGDGAYGPTILLATQSTDGVALVRSVFGRLSSSPPGTSVWLDNDPDISLSAALWSLELRVVSESPEKHLIRSDQGVGFTWIGTQADWETMSLLIEPLLRQAGHQYLTSEAEDDALVEFSRGEDHG
jgi:hypothetical protein